MTDLPFSCTCGTVRGRLIDPSPRRGAHATCYCRDCQAFARHTGHADDTLDAAGGTGIYQTVPSRIAFDAGAERLRALRLTERGVYRWYAECCGAPVANTAPAAGIPLCGVIASRLGRDRAEREAAIGPVRYVAFARGATAPPDTAGKGGLFGLSVATLPQALKAKLRGDTSSPFFEAGEPISEPRMLTEAERDAAYVS